MDELVVERGALADGLELCRYGISRHFTGLEVLSSVLMEKRGDFLCCHTNNFDVAVSVKIPASGKFADTVVPCIPVARAAKAMGSQTLALSTGEMLVFAGQDETFQTLTRNMASVPEREGVDKPLAKVTFTRAQIEEMLRVCGAFRAQSDHPKGVLTGFGLTLKKTESGILAEYASTDTHHAAYGTFEVSGSIEGRDVLASAPRSFIIAPMLTALRKYKPQTVTLSCDERRLCFSFADSRDTRASIEIVGTMSDNAEKFPLMGKVLKHFEAPPMASVIFRRAELVAIIGRGALLSGRKEFSVDIKNGTARLFFGRDELKNFDYYGLDDSSNRYCCVAKSGLDPWQRGQVEFTTKIVQNILRHAKGEFVRLRLWEGFGPIQRISCDADGNPVIDRAQFVAMPRQAPPRQFWN